MKDWGYYDEKDGDCLKCKDQCNHDPNCGAIECGNNYCSWWKVGICNSRKDPFEHKYTCRKGSLMPISKRIIKSVSSDLYIYVRLIHASLCL